MSKKTQKQKRELSSTQDLLNKYFSPQGGQKCSGVLITTVLQDCTKKYSNYSDHDNSLPLKSGFTDDLEQSRNQSNGTERLEILNTYARLFPTRPYTALIEYTYEKEKNFILNTSELVPTFDARTNALEEYCKAKDKQLKQAAKIELYKVLYETGHNYINNALVDYKKELAQTGQADNTIDSLINNFQTESRLKDNAKNIISQESKEHFNGFVDWCKDNKHDLFPENKHDGLLEIITTTKGISRFSLNPQGVGNIPHVEMKGIQSALKKTDYHVQDINLGLAPYTNYTPSTCGGCSAEITALRASKLVAVNVTASSPQSLPAGKYQLSSNTLTNPNVANEVVNSDFILSLYARAEFYSREDVCRLLGVSDETLRQLQEFKADVSKLRPGIEEELKIKQSQGVGSTDSQNYVKGFYSDQDVEILIEASLKKAGKSEDSDQAQRLKRTEKEQLTNLTLNQADYNLGDSLTAINDDKTLLNKIDREAAITANLDIKSIDVQKKADIKNTSVEIIGDEHHLDKHKSGVESLIARIKAPDGAENKIEKGTVIAIECKEYGENLGMKDVIKLAAIMEHNEKQKEASKKLAITEEIVKSPIYQDAVLYKTAKEHGVKVIGLEGRNLEHDKTSPSYDTNREQYMIDVINEVRNKGYNVIAHVGSAHVANLENGVKEAAAKEATGLSKIPRNLIDKAKEIGTSVKTTGNAQGNGNNVPARRENQSMTI